MPAAVANTEDTVRHDLKSCEGGYVVLRCMTFGQSVERRALTKLSLDLGGKGKKKDDPKGELALASREITGYEFRHCIVDHNLCHADGETRLNFNNPNDVNALDPRIGQEIEGYINDMNRLEDEGE